MPRAGDRFCDTGTLQFGDEVVPVKDTRKENNLTVQFVDRLPASLEGPVVAYVEPSLRKATAVHHTATHLLHAALRGVLGTHVAQKGSLVNADYLRFDFSHFAKVTEEEIARVEAIVNQKIRGSGRHGPVWREIWREGSRGYYRPQPLIGGTHVGSTGELVLR